MSVVVLKYNAGNVESVLHALHRIGIEAELTDVPERIFAAAKVIFPGVGEASSAMQYLRERKLDEVLRGLRQPVLGICLGMQLLCEYSDENAVDCLGVIPGRLTRFEGDGLKVPHMGWNRITDLRSALFADVPEGGFVYFAHSYFAARQPQTIATAEHGAPFSAALQQHNFYGVQFHPEKSAEVGEKVLRNFLAL